MDVGKHTEQAIFSTILSLLLADQILDTKIPHVYQVSNFYFPQFWADFQTAFQDGPLDFFTKDFYASRKASIQARFEAFSEETDTVLSEMKAVWQKYPDG